MFKNKEEIYGSWSLVELKNELRKRNAKVHGKKADLVARLVAYDGLQCKSNVSGSDDTYNMEIPSCDKFRDINIHSHLPSLNKTHLNTYLNICGKQLDKRAKRMYEEKYLICIRSAFVNNQFIVSGRVASEFRKQLVYLVHIKLSTNSILEAQCECAAGKGPNALCKHVFVVIYAVLDHAKGKITVQETCTDNLQSFQKPKKYHGSPVKAKDLIVRKKLTYKRLIDFDPRRNISNKEEVSNNVRNLCISYAATYPNERKMPILQLYPPANLIAVNRDHDYLKFTPEEIFLRSFYILTDIECHIMELVTRGQTQNKEWQKQHCYRLSSSKFGKICKAAEMTKKKLAKSLTEYKEVFAPSLSHGMRYESVALQKFSSITNLAYNECGLYVHKKYGYLCASPDGVGSEYLVEVKCPYSARNKFITPETVPYLYLCDQTGTLKLNEHHDYYFQVQGQLSCTNKKVCYFVVYTMKDITVTTVERDEVFISSILKKLEVFYEHFFKDAVLTKFVYKDFENYYC